MLHTACSRWQRSRWWPHPCLWWLLLPRLVRALIIGITAGGGFWWPGSKNEPTASTQIKPEYKACTTAGTFSTGTRDHHLHHSTSVQPPAGVCAIIPVCGAVSGARYSASAGVRLWGSWHCAPVAWDGRATTWLLWTGEGISSSETGQATVLNVQNMHWLLKRATSSTNAQLDCHHHYHLLTFLLGCVILM